jgi:hypothetical protein
VDPWRENGDVVIAGRRRRLALVAGADLVILTTLVWAMVAEP